MSALLGIVFSLFCCCIGQLLVAALPMDYYNDQLVTYLHVGQPHIQDAHTPLQTMYAHNRVQIYCVRAQPLRAWNIFQSRYLQLRIAGDADYKQYKATTPQSVYRAHLLRRESYEGKLLGARCKLSYINLEPHQLSCYGLYTYQGYALTLLQCNCDEERLAQFCLGLVLYAAAPLLGKSRCFCQVTAVCLGILLARLGVVYVALLATRNAHVKDVMKLQPLQENFKQLLMQYTPVVTIALVCGAWILHNWWKRWSTLWRYAWVRYAHRCLLRLTAYYMVYFASAHAGFGKLCLTLLVPWPELWQLLRWLKQLRLWCCRLWPPRLCTLVSAEQNQAQCNYKTDVCVNRLCQQLQRHSSTWQHVTELQAPQQFSDFISGDSHVLAPSTSFAAPELPQTAPSSETMPRQSSLQNAQLHVPFTGQALPATAFCDESLPERMPSVMNLHSYVYGTASTRTLYYNAKFVGSSRSLINWSSP